MERSSIGAVCVSLVGITSVVMGAWFGWDAEALARICTATIAAVVALTGSKPGGVASAVGLFAGTETFFGGWS